MGESDRITVLASLREFGGTLSFGEASKKYGVPRGTVCRWAKERKDGKEPGEVVKLATVPPVGTPRAREAARGREVRALEMRRALGDEAREDLRTTGGNLIRYLRQQTQLAVDGPPAELSKEKRRDWRPPDMQQVAAAARSLDALLSRAADVLAFDRTTTAPADAPAALDPMAVRAEVSRRRRG